MLNNNNKDFTECTPSGDTVDDSTQDTKSLLCLWVSQEFLASSTSSQHKVFFKLLPIEQAIWLFKSSLLNKCNDFRLI